MTLLILRSAPKEKERHFQSSVFMASGNNTNNTRAYPSKAHYMPITRLSFFLFPKNQLKASPSATLKNVTLHYCDTDSSYACRSRIKSLAYLWLHSISNQFSAGQRLRSRRWQLTMVETEQHLKGFSVQPALEYFPTRSSTLLIRIRVDSSKYNIAYATDLT